MAPFTGFQYLLIDVANQYGHDKLLFEERIEWATANLNSLEAQADKAETLPLYRKAVMAIRKAQQGIPTGHLVGFDAVCSGVQLMSVLTGCVAGATATGLVDPNVRADAYTALTRAMQSILGTGFNVARSDAKQALMTSMYGSKKTPREIFGDNTPELNAFYKAAATVAPGAWELLQELLASWQPGALMHSWKLPDGFDVRIKVMTKKQARIEVDELDHATFTYEFYENEGQDKGLSNAANVIHSVDAYVLRAIHRRCNYTPEVVSYVDKCLEEELITRSLFGQPEASEVDLFMSEKTAYYIEQYNRSGMPDAVILPYLNQASVTCLSQKHLEAMAVIVSGMLEYSPFEVVTIHDEFKCHPNNMNHLRQQYINVLAELAESNLIGDVLGQIHGTTGTYTKLSNDLGDKIRKSNYALS
jgi:hypothetical protein